MSSWVGVVRNTMFIRLLRRIIAPRIRLQPAGTLFLKKSQLIEPWMIGDLALSAQQRYWRPVRSRPARDRAVYGLLRTGPCLAINIYNRLPQPACLLEYQRTTVWCIQYPSESQSRRA